jgi:hypothetical protein
VLRDFRCRCSRTPVPCFCSFVLPRRRKSFLAPVRRRKLTKHRESLSTPHPPHASLRGNDKPMSHRAAGRVREAGGGGRTKGLGVSF